MKKTLSILIAICFALPSLFAQSPETFSYQAVARDGGGIEIVNQKIGVQFKLHQSTANGTVVYSETHSPTTNAIGLFTLAVGNGEPTLGIFSDIDWSTDPYFLEVGIDPSGSTSYVNMGTQQLLSVPYALHSKTADSLTDIDSFSWSTTGNAGTIDSINFIGTTDNEPLIFKVNSIQAGRIPSLYGDYNTFFGLTAGINTLGFYNTAMGGDALSNTNTGNNNTAFGYRALDNNTTGNSNTAAGRSTLASNTTGYDNTAIGDAALLLNETGDYNTAIGSAALRNNETGSNNTATGYQALYNTTEGSNTAYGYRALYNNTTGHGNIAVGSRALYNNLSGYNNIAIGGIALYDNLSGNRRTGIGQSANSYGESYYNNTGLGHGADCSASNQVRIGDPYVTSIGGSANWSNVSDERFKKDITEDVSGLEFITALRPVTYHMDLRAIDNWWAQNYNERDSSLVISGNEKEKIRYTGFIAQEVEAAAHEIGYDFSGVDAPKNDKDYYGLRYAEFVVPLVKGMQEQQELIEQQKAEIEAQNEKYNKLLKRIEELEKNNNQ
jgi:hypothetical protein